MEKRVCGWCGGGMVTVRAGATYCSSRCRVYAHRDAKRHGKLPQQMRDARRFVRYTSTKRPITVAGKSASSTNPATWSTHGEASASTEGEGIGFVLGDGIGCIDLDHCFTENGLQPWASEVLEKNLGTFVEVSRSGEGLHIFGLAPETAGRKIRDGRNIEIYSVGRYIAMTGRRYRQAPLELAPLVLP